MLLLLAGCSRSQLELAEVEGPPAMVDDGGKPRLWVLTKQEEVRLVSVDGGGSHSSGDWRSDTFFHFGVQAFDPLAAQPLWHKRLVTFGDPDARGFAPSRVLGSAVDARLLGQDGNIVWLLIGEAPYALDAADAHVVTDAARLQEVNPELRGLLPSEAKYYGFDRGLVLTAADARQFVVRGPDRKAVAYTPPPPPSAPEGRLQANGTRETVPSRPPGENPSRLVTLGGQRLGLYSEKEAADAAQDDWGRKLRYPYSILDEGKLSRRTFWRAKIVAAQRFDDHFERLSELTPIPGTPTFLKGRFKTDPATGEPLVLPDPESVLVWHSTRIDDSGRLAVTRLDAALKPLWQAELPLSETDPVRQVATWLVSGHLIVVGELRTVTDGVQSRTPQIVTIDLNTGTLRSMDLRVDGPAR
ncbi:MAG: PA2928 family protein [Planctomycetota bacterium]